LNLNGVIFDNRKSFTDFAFFNRITNAPLGGRRTEGPMRRMCSEDAEIRTAQQQQIGEGVDLGMWLGRRQAFALMAGRCSAADAECIREARRNKRYRALKMTWEQFCVERLGITSVTANKIVRQLEEFGPEFFTLAQLTRVTPEEYRRLKVAVRGHALLHAGEEIPIEAENGPRLAAAIDELRRNAKADLTASAEPVEVAEERVPGNANLQIDPFRTADLEIGAPRRRESSETLAEPAGDPADGMTAAESGIASAEQSLHTALTELERLQAMHLELDERVRLHSLVGYGAHKFNLLQLAVRV
jgi:hypothetical protein